MGQNQSSEKPTSRSATPQTERERKVNRRISVQALSKGPSQPADASASTVAAQGTTTHNLETANLERMLQSTSSELTSKSSRAERSTSRASRRKRDEEHETRSMQKAVNTPSLTSTGSIDIPTSSALPSRSRQEELQDDSKVSSAYDERSYAPVSHHRPPRLPLPIAEPGAMPDSPNLGPVDKNDSDVVPLFDTDDHDPLSPGTPARGSSMISVATQDEEDISEELQPFGVGVTGQTVATVIEWNQPAEKVFVTGTFAAWDKKFRLKKSESGINHWKTTINLPPGTHHLKFFVDNQMVTSPQLPTAVDFNNILVNYIEISTDDIPRSRRESSQLAPGATIQPPYQAQPPLSPRPDEESREEYSGTASPGEDHDEAGSYSTDSIPVTEMPEGDFRQLTPQALVDVDFPDHDKRYEVAADIIREQPHPPSLPLFLSKSILNGNLPMKDDGSVLALPNHTVLNHLMTSNVRNGVLATSVTTRYKKKYVTTISFKPVPVIHQRREGPA